jgi:hypothetical protein
VMIGSLEHKQAPPPRGSMSERGSGGRSDDAAVTSEPHWSENPTALLGEEG